MRVDEYFAYFQYLPTLEEFHLFYSKKISRVQLKHWLKHNHYLIQNNRIFQEKNRQLLAGTIKRRNISLTKINTRRQIIKKLSRINGVEFIGLSGSISMLNANLKDDLDLFVIAGQNRLWTVRFWLIILTSLMGIRRKPADKEFQDKLCFNLFFSLPDLRVPKQKQSEYIAHEILQLKPVVNKNQIYERFLQANQWVGKFYPNSKIKNQKLEIKMKAKKEIIRLRLGDLIELLLKKIQLWLINQHRTEEIITDTQLWFFPHDFEKRIAKYLKNN